MISKELQSRLDSAEALIFDMDGTLADNMDLHLQAWSKAASHYSLHLTEKRFYELGGVPTYQIFEMLSSEQNIEIDLAEATSMKENLYQKLLPNVKPFALVVAIAKAYKDKIPMAVATGSTAKGADWVLSKLEIKSWFGAIVTSDDDVKHKPAPDVFLEACRQLGVDASKCVGFEDTDLGIQSIKSAGMYAVDVRQFSDSK